MPWPRPSTAISTVLLCRARLVSRENAVERPPRVGEHRARTLGLAGVTGLRDLEDRDAGLSHLVPQGGRLGRNVVAAGSPATPPVAAAERRTAERGPAEAEEHRSPKAPTRAARPAHREHLVTTRAVRAPLEKVTPTGPARAFRRIPCHRTHLFS